MKAFHLITVGKLKEASYLELEKEYLKRLKDFSLTIHEARSCEENLELESQAVLKILDNLNREHHNIKIIALTERGALRDSLTFSNWIYQQLESTAILCFIIGGASGHGLAILKRCDSEISLSPLTFPHKMARLILIEQLYRASTIKNGHPYHK